MEKDGKSNHIMWSIRLQTLLERDEAWDELKFSGEANNSKDASDVVVEDEIVLIPKQCKKKIVKAKSVLTATDC